MSSAQKISIPFDGFAVEFTLSPTAQITPAGKIANHGQRLSERVRRAMRRQASRGRA